MISIMTSTTVTIIAFLICNTFAISHSEMIVNNTGGCSDYKDCNTCFGDTDCAFWWCADGDVWTGDMACELPGEKKPKIPCEGKWKKLQLPHNCSDVHKKNSSMTSPSESTLYVEDSKRVKNTENESEIVVNKKQSMSYAKGLINDNGCSDYKDCHSCFGDTDCAFWWCADADVWTGDMVCELPGEKKPKIPCEGKWKKLQIPHNCSEVHLSNTTTTTTPSTTTTTKSTTTTTTQSPETTTDKNTTTTTTTTTKPTTSIPITTTASPEPPHEGEGKLTGWTIAGITICSILVVVILIGVSYKKVMKIYRARNPYVTLNN